jgi:sporulation protein YlmC with PRC-barrel domain
VPALAQTSTTTTATDTQTQGTTELQTEAQGSADTSATTSGEAAETTAETSTTEAGEASTDASTEPADGATGEAILTRQRPGQVRADRLIGAKVTNAKSEDVGDVSDILLDKKGNVVGVLLSVGGFLGIGDKTVAVNWDEIQLQEDGEQVVVNMSKKQISDAPAFEAIEELSGGQQAEGDVPPADATTGTATDATGSGATTAQ